MDFGLKVKIWTGVREVTDHMDAMCTAVKKVLLLELDGVGSSTDPASRCLSGKR